MHTQVHTQTHSTHTSAYTHTQVPTRIHAHSTSAHIHMYMYMHTRTHTCTHTASHRSLVEWSGHFSFSICLLAWAEDTRLWPLLASAFWTSSPGNHHCSYFRDKRKSFLNLPFLGTLPHLRVATILCFPTAKILVATAALDQNALQVYTNSSC